MGIGSFDIEVILGLRQAGQIPTPGAICEIGAQQLNSTAFDPDLFKRTAALFNVDPATFPKAPVEAPHPDQPITAASPLARPFWEALGFTYASIDIDDSPGAIPLDLNYDGVPEESKGKFSLVTNYGTTEHVANQLNAFEVIHDLTAVDGVMLCSLPTQGFSNHGLVNYNLKFFWMLARSNEYEWLHVNYVSGGDPQPLNPDVVGHVKLFSPDFPERAKRMHVPDQGVVVALKKRIDRAFIAPLDSGSGEAPNAELKARYWTVFGGEPPAPPPPPPAPPTWWQRLKEARLLQP